MIQTNRGLGVGTGESSSSLTQALLGKKVSPIRHDLLHVAKATPEDMDQIEALTYDHR